MTSEEIETSQIGSENGAEQKDHDVPPGGYFKPPLYLQRYDFVKSIIDEVGAKSVVDLGCAECKFVTEVARGEVTRVVGVDFDQILLYQSISRFTDRFDAHYNRGLKRTEDLMIEIFAGDVTKECDSRLIGVDFVSCIELIEHINPEDHPGLLETIFGKIKPKTAVLTTPNSDFNSYWQTMPHGKYRHPDHRFEWSRQEFDDFVEETLRKYPEYEVNIDGIGMHWGGKTINGLCSQAAIFKRKTEMELIDGGGTEVISRELTENHTYELCHSVKVKKYDFEEILYQAILRAIDPFIGIKNDEDDLQISVNHHVGVGYRKGYYNKPFVTRSAWIPENGFCPLLDRDYSPRYYKSRKRSPPPLTFKYKYTLNDEDCDSHNFNLSDDEDGGPAKSVRKISEGWGEETPSGSCEGWSSAPRSESFVSSPSSKDIDWSSQRMTKEEFLDTVYKARLKMEMTRTVGQFDDIQDEDEGPAAKNKKMCFDGYLASLTEISCLRQYNQHYRLTDIVNFYSVAIALENENISNLWDKQIELLKIIQKRSNSSIQMFKTTKGEIRLQSTSSSDYDRNVDHSGDHDIENRSLQSVDSEW